MKFAIFISLMMIFTLCEGKNTEDRPSSESFFDFTMQNVRGQNIDLKSFEGNVLLVVNTASMCGFTKQYEELQALHEKYADQGFSVLAFPSGDFMSQEFGSDEEIAEFCEVNFGITFPLFSKVSVRGNDKHNLFAYLIQQDNQDFTGGIRWNFEKFLISPEGQLVRRFRSSVTPFDNEITSAIESLL